MQPAVRVGAIMGHDEYSGVAHAIRLIKQSKDALSYEPHMGHDGDLPPPLLPPPPHSPPLPAPLRLALIVK